MFKMEPWRAVNVHNGGLKAQNEAYKPVVADSRHFEEGQDLDLLESEKLGRDPQKVMQICNPGRRYG
jgi:hypothetical protein